MDYTPKYKKYKIKYLKLKNQIGGAVASLDVGQFIGKQPRKENGIYTMISHGCDFSSEILDVPEGCVYVTFVTTGNAANGASKQYKIFKEMFSSNNELLKDPIGNLKQLQEIFNTDLHVHYPGAKDPNMKKYVNSLFDSSLGVEEVDKTFFLKSGLYSLGSNINKDFCLIDKKITDANIKYIYEDSIYPTTYEIIDVYRFVDQNFSQFTNEISTVFGTDQKTLFKYFPGIYYNFVCRVDCHTGETSEKSEERISQSFGGNLRELGIAPESFVKENIFEYLKDGNLEASKSLIEKSNHYDFEIKNEEGRTPLYISCEKRYYDIAKLLVDKGINLDPETYKLCLFRGMEKGNREFYRYMVENNIAEIKRDKEGATKFFGHSF
jgi:hypothetical protein